MTRDFDYLTAPSIFFDVPGLSLREVMAMSIVYSFSRDGESTFKGSIAYVSQILKCARHTVINTMSSLVSKGYIGKRQLTVGGVTVNEYFMRDDHIEKILKFKNCTGSAEIAPPPSAEIAQVVQNLHTDNISRISSDILPQNKKEKESYNLKVIAKEKANETEENLAKEETVAHISQPPKTTLAAKQEDMRKREQAFKESLYPYCTSKGGQYEAEMVEDFFNYWSEPNKSGTKMRFEIQQTFEISRRLATWAKKQDNYGRNTTGLIGGGQAGTGAPPVGYGGIPVGLSRSEAKLLAIQQERRRRGF